MEAAVASIKAQAKKVKSRDEKASVAAISAHNDKDVGKMLADAFEKVGDEGVITIEEATGLDTRVEVVEGKLSTESKSYEAAKKALQRLLKDVYPESSAKEEVAIPAEILKAAKALALLCVQYEGAKSLAAKAVGKAFAA